MRNLLYRHSLMLLMLTALIVSIEPTFAQNYVSLDTSPEGFPKFARHVIDDDFSAGYQTGVADINSDGRLDILALSTSPTRLHWYRNPDWTRHIITTATNRNIDMAPYDIDGDGDTDLAIASQFRLQETTTGGLLQWLEQPENPTREWTLHDIDSIPTSHRIRWADIDGNGIPELLNLPILGIGAEPPEYDIGLLFKAYWIPEQPKTDPWPSSLIDTTLNMAHGMAVVRWNEDIRDDVLTASFDGVNLYLMCGQGIHSEKLHMGAGNRGLRPKQGSSEVAPGKLGNIRYLATIEPWHGHQVVAYTPENGILPWRRTVIDSTFDDGHAIACADLDGDGNDEIVAGYRGSGTSLYIYRYLTEKQQWQRIPLDAGGMAAAGVRIADFNGDGRLDVAATGTSTANVVWYENLGNEH
jgi:hypothetical protein